MLVYTIRQYCYNIVLGSARLKVSKKCNPSMFGRRNQISLADRACSRAFARPRTQVRTANRAACKPRKAEVADTNETVAAAPWRLFFCRVNATTKIVVPRGPGSCLRRVETTRALVPILRSLRVHNAEISFPLAPAAAQWIFDFRFLRFQVPANRLTICAREPPPERGVIFPLRRFAPRRNIA